MSKLFVSELLCDSCIHQCIAECPAAPEDVTWDEGTDLIVECQCYEEVDDGSDI